MCDTRTGERGKRCASPSYTMVDTQRYFQRKLVQDTHSPQSRRAGGLKMYNEVTPAELCGNKISQDVLEASVSQDVWQPQLLLRTSLYTTSTRPGGLPARKTYFKRSSANTGQGTLFYGIYELYFFHSTTFFSFLWNNLFWANALKGLNQNKGLRI